MLRAAVTLSIPHRVTAKSSLEMAISREAPKTSRNPNIKNYPCQDLREETRQLHWLQGIPHSLPWETVGTLAPERGAAHPGPFPVSCGLQG